MNQIQDLVPKQNKKRGLTAHHRKREKTTNSTERAKDRNKNNKTCLPSQDSTKIDSEIDPMLAAKVVKEYLLPMFRKRQPLTKNEKHADKNMMQLIQESRTGNDLYVMAQTYLPDTVFGQLKLSDILYQRIEKLEIEDSEKNDILRQIQDQRDETLEECMRLKGQKRKFELQFQLLK